MTPKPRRWWHPIAAYFLKFFLTCYTKTWDITFVGKEDVEKHLQTAPVGAIFLLWHDTLLMAPTLQFISRYQPITVLISNSRDGDLASTLAMQYDRVTVLRVKHLARAHALLESCHALQSRSSLVITPDGPRGPRHEMKPGAAYAAEKTGAVSFFVHCTPSRFISLRSWDKFMIPLPFSKITVTFSRHTSQKSESTTLP